eukprot:CAMPEP_0183706206 /NCGR_PEP_ID=MMETSP0737-20130205/3099_1 /TAXON_ID=385413 /ORGANISM="Thalassiosira miniscula, Strain CCMP1093" /LENGTH=390 /DNA_ID=CAMNT_0025933557 /DNA_START=48 /DNA_END=1220 /DNA_ORIENTATION=+
MIQTRSAAAGIIAAFLAVQSSAFSSPPTQLPASPHLIKPKALRSTSSALRLSNDDEVQKLLAKAKQLREEAAAMSGKTVEEMEQEVQREKELTQKQQEIMEKARKEREEKGSRNNMAILPVPDDAASQIQQAASAVERAFADGIVRQTVRFALLEEEEAMTGEVNEWPGGAKQMYREAGRPLTESLLREVSAYSKKEIAEENNDASQSRMPPEVTAEDIWDFDGSAIISAKAAGGPHGDVAAIVFPNTDTKYLKDIESIAETVGPKRLLLLINPFWKDVESWGFNILAPNGKKRAQEVIFDNGYDVTYAVLRFSVRGEDCVALKAYPYDWQMYAYREDPSWFNQERPVWLGSSKDEPKSSQISELLNSRPEFKMSKNMRQMQRMMGNDDQ